MAEERRQRVTHPAGGKSRTKQGDRAGTNANEIFRKWINTGLVSQQREPGSYGDFSSGVDYFTAMSRVRAAEQEFDLLPAAIRKECKNDPAMFLDMVFDPKERAKLEELGLVESEAPVDAPAASEPEQEAAPAGQAEEPAEPA